jgi:alkylated DNA nucleotide flippase Atl1
MASNRAADVAEVLWELKRAGKLATLSAIAERAGFSPGADCKAVRKCLATIRQEWEHLEWWRAIEDDGTVEAKGDHMEPLRGLGIEFADERKGFVSLKIDEELIMVWEEAEPVAPVAAIVPEAE